MAGSKKQAGSSLKTKKPQCGNTEASRNEINFEEEIVMANNSTAVSNVIPFRFEKKEVRTLLIDDQPWFAAQDILDSLEYSETYKPSRAVAHVPEQWKAVHRMHTPGGAQQVMMLSEQGLYFVLGRSDKPKALPFQMWVAGDVLPSIRKHGHYADRHGTMGDLVGAVIGTSGENVLDRVIDQKASPVPHSLQRSFKHTMKSRLRSRFNVQRTALIPAECLADACNFVAAYALEGEWIHAEKTTDGVLLNKHEAQHLYLLMSRFAFMSRHKESMLSAARALDSRPLMEFFDQLTEGGSSFAYLDQRKDELYEIYQSFGCKGGYAWRASA